MCGIAGWVQMTGFEPQTLVTMTQTAAHRGPDGEGYWFWDDATTTGLSLTEAIATGSRRRYRVALGHTRLAILDLSDAGHQPMASPDGQLWLTYNGEIYNYLELRDELRGYGYAFTTGTDTEVLLRAYQHWGTNCFRHFNGQWALGLVDVRRQQLILSRDRLGIKPLYLWTTAAGMAFSSEIKQLLTLPGARAVAHMPAVLEYIATGHEQPEVTFFHDIVPFPAGAWGAIDFSAGRVREPQAYWEPAKLDPRPMGMVEAVGRTRELVADATNRCRRADVPVGVAFSGGLDSSILLSLLHQLRGGVGPRPQAFSAIFPGADVDEQAYQRAVFAWGENNGPRHAVMPTAEDFLKDCAHFVYHHDEPVGSLSQYATWCVMRRARQEGVPVLLSGQGGDELFSGYWPASYLWLRTRLHTHVGQALREVLGAALPGGNPELLRQAWSHWRTYRSRQQGSLRALLHAPWRQPPAAPRSWGQVAQTLTPEAYRRAELCHVHLPRLLKWDDRNSMAFSVEGRYPLLDRDLVDWALAMPVDLNLHHGWNKVVLRQASGALLPPAIQWRKTKVGFETPQAQWISTTLRPTLRRWLDDPSARLAALVHPQRLRLWAAPLLTAPRLQALDERPLGLMRCFFLDQWLERFQVDVP